jgi:hypothetical protein
MSSAAARRARGVAAILALVALAVCRSSIGTRLDAVTIDEPWHIVAGTEYVRLGDFRLNPEHPPLVKLWIGALMPASFKLRPSLPITEKEREREMVEATFFEDNGFREVQARARAAMWTFHGALLVALALLLWRAFGFPWAAASLALLAVEPTVGAHLPVVMTDLPLALCLANAALAGGLLLATWSWGWAATLGLALGLALGAKHSALAGVAAILGACTLGALGPLARARDGREAARRAARVLVSSLVAWGLLWGLYGFHFHARRDGADRFNRPMSDKVSELKVDFWRRAIAVADEARLVPRAYLWGLADTVRVGVEGRADSAHLLWGTWHLGRPPWITWPSYVIVKVPLGLLLMALLGVVSIPRLPLTETARAALAVMTAMAGGHLAALLASQGSYAGVRHALPLVIFLGVLGGAAL